LDFHYKKHYNIVMIFACGKCIEDWEKGRGIHRRLQETGYYSPSTVKIPPDPPLEQVGIIGVSRRSRELCYKNPPFVKGDSGGFLFDRPLIQQY
jgi:hypothetical protein